LFHVFISVSGSNRDCYLPVVTSLLCRESRKLTEQLQHVIGTGYDQRLVVLTRSWQNQQMKDKDLSWWERKKISDLTLCWSDKNV